MPNINISNIFFAKSITDVKHKPQPLLPEVAVLGRSNVGKSTLINTLFNQKKLAKISSKPGKTRLINFFNVDDKLYLVDLPGYGFAQGSKTEINTWEKMIEGYLINNSNLRFVLLLIDARRGLMPIDEQMLNWLNHFNIKYKIVLTKIDKLSNNELYKVNQELKNRNEDLLIINHSAKTKKGRNELLNLLNYTLNVES